MRYAACATSMRLAAADLVEGTSMRYALCASSMRYAHSRKKFNYCHFSAPCLILIRIFLPDLYLLGPRAPFPGKKGFSWTVPLRHIYIHIHHRPILFSGGSGVSSAGSRWCQACTSTTPFLQTSLSSPYTRSVESAFTNQVQYSSFLFTFTYTKNLIQS